VCFPPPPLQLTVAEYVEFAFGFSFDDRWYFVLSTFLFAVVYRSLAILATRYVLQLHCCFSLQTEAALCFQLFALIAFPSDEAGQSVCMPPDRTVTFHCTCSIIIRRSLMFKLEAPITESSFNFNHVAVI
jgi:hypothetical protein